MKKTFLIFFCFICLMFFQNTKINAMNASDAIDFKAQELAWPISADVKQHKEKGGGPTSAYKEAIEKNCNFPKSQLKYKYTKGISCSVFVATVVRDTGYDKSFPYTDSKIYNYVKNSSKYKQVDVSNAVAGDILVKKNQGHFLIYGGYKNGYYYFYEANLGKSSGNGDYGYTFKKDSLSYYKKDFYAFHATGTVSSENIKITSKNQIGAQQINDQAIKLAWPYGTSSNKKDFNYNKYTKFTSWSQLTKGSPTSAFERAYDKVRPKHWSVGSEKYGYGPRVGASCDVFVATVVRSVGYDSSLPFGLEGQWDYFPKHSEKWQKVKYSLDNLQPGDIITYSNNGHIMIYVEIDGNGYLAQAGLNRIFGQINKLKDSSKKSNVKIWRATNSGTSILYDDEEQLLEKINTGKKYESCNQLLSDDVVKALKIVFLLIKIITPLMLIVLTMIDFAKAITNDGDTTKVIKKFVKRSIIAICIFLVPVICEFAMDITGISDGVCGIN